MSILLQAITEISEVSELSDRIQADKLKTSSFHTPETTISSMISSKIERDSIITLLKGKIKRIELLNTNVLRNAENIKIKQEFLSEARKYYENFQDNLECYKNDSLVKLEIRKKKIQYFSKTLKENIVRSKENVLRRKSEKRKQMLIERSENEDYIRRRDAYYLKEAKEISLNEKRRAISVACTRKNSLINKNTTNFSNKKNLL